MQANFGYVLGNLGAAICKICLFRFFPGASIDHLRYPLFEVHVKPVFEDDGQVRFSLVVVKMKSDCSQRGLPKYHTLMNNVGRIKYASANAVEAVIPKRKKKKLRSDFVVELW